MLEIMWKKNDEQIRGNLHLLYIIIIHQIHESSPSHCDNKFFIIQIKKEQGFKKWPCPPLVSVWLASSKFFKARNIHAQMTAVLGTILISPGP